MWGLLVIQISILHLDMILYTHIWEWEGESLRQLLHFQQVSRS